MRNRSAKVVDSNNNNAPTYVSSNGKLIETENEKDVRVKEKDCDSKSRERTMNLEDLDLVETIGVGTFGRVVLAHDPETEEYYALKVLALYEILEKKQIQNVRNERDALIAGRGHPFIINLMWHTKDCYNIYFLLEYAAGGELFSYLRQSKKFSVETAAFYSAEIVCALEFLHKKDIAHRDLKPENLLLDDKGHLKMTDFGYSKRITNRAWSVCGTPEYLSPEMVQGLSYTKAVDFWALGILIYEMLVGQSPFYDQDKLTCYENIVNGTINFPHDFDNAAKDLVEKLLVPEKLDRLGTGKNGIKDIKDHPFFRRLDWTKVYKRQIVPPIIPLTSHPGDTSNFGKYEYSWTVQDVTDQQLDLFADF